MLRLPTAPLLALVLVLALTLAAFGVSPVWAHGGVTGMQDIVQDYGVYAFLIAVVLIGAGVLTWVMLSPQPDVVEEAEETETV